MLASFASARHFACGGAQASCVPRVVARVTFKEAEKKSLTF